MELLELLIETFLKAINRTVLMIGNNISCFAELVIEILNSEVKGRKENARKNDQEESEIDKET